LLQPLIDNNEADLWDSDNIKELTLVDKVKFMFRDPCFCWLTAASFFRFFGGYSLGFLSPTFFEKMYPDNNSDYAYMNTIIVTGGGLPACLIGGWLSDNMEEKYPTIKAMISGYGALIAIPFIAFTYLI